MAKSSVAALLGGKNDFSESLKCYFVKRKESENSVVNDHEVCVALVNIHGSLSLREDISLNCFCHITTLCSFFLLSGMFFLSNGRSKKTFCLQDCDFFFF